MKYSHYAGIDCGFSGAISVINAAGTVAKVWDMPITQRNKKEDGTREFDLHGLHVIFKSLHFLPNVLVTLEWASTRPGEGAERCERYGRGKGYIEAFLFLMGFKYDKVAPSIWKSRLGLPGKMDDPRSSQGEAFWKEKGVPPFSLLYGPRGGLLDGRLDALLLAYYGRLGSQSPLGWHGGPRPAVYQGTTRDQGWKGIR